jgi:ribonucleotide reductase alpha subunit
MERRYLLRDEDGYIIETPTSLFQRVAHAIASAETNFDPAADVSSRNRICWRLPARDMSLLGHLEIVISYYHHPSLPATSGYNLLRMHRQLPAVITREKVWPNIK